MVRPKFQRISCESSFVLDSALRNPRIGTERSKERERGAVAKWLIEPWYGTAKVHWLVSCAYIACPLSSLLVLVVAMESRLCLNMSKHLSVVVVVDHSHSISG